MTTKQIENNKKEILGRAIALNNGKREGSDIFLSVEDKIVLKELMFRALITTCVCFGDEKLIFDEQTQKWGETGEEYGVFPLGDKKAMAIWTEQKAYINKHARIVRDAKNGRRVIAWN